MTHGARRGWHWASDWVSVYFAFSGKPTHVARAPKYDAVKAIAEASKLAEVTLMTDGWHDADVMCDGSMSPPIDHAKVCRVTT